MKLKWIKILIPFSTLIVAISSAWMFPSRVFSYDTHVAHPGITDLAANLYNEHFGNSLTAEQIAWIKEGATQEDTPTRWMNHFYDPVHNNGLKGGYLSAKDWATSPNAQASYALGDKSWQRALADFKKGNNKNAFQELGHVLHLVEDMAVPAHTRDDIHVTGDSYEQFVKNNFQNLISTLSLNYIEVSSLNDAFNDLATYSNNNFYSDDTTNNSFDSPLRSDVTEEKINDDAISIDVLYIDNKTKIKLCKGQKMKNWKGDLISVGKIIDICDLEEPLVLTSYSQHLLPRAIGTSAGVIKLFLDEASKPADTDTTLPANRENLLGITNRLLGSIITSAEDIYNSLKNVNYTSQTNTANATQQNETIAPTAPQNPPQQITTNQPSPAQTIPKPPTKATPPKTIKITPIPKPAQPQIALTPPPTTPQPPITPPPAPPKPAPATIPHPTPISALAFGSPTPQTTQENPTETPFESPTSTTITNNTATSTPDTPDTTPPPPPTLAQTWPEIFFTSSTEIEIAGTNSTDTAKLAIYFATSTNNAAEIISTQDTSSTTWSLTSELAENTNIFLFAAIDAAGNTSTLTSAIHIEKDSTPPPIPTFTTTHDTPTSTQIHLTITQNNPVSSTTFFNLAYTDVSSTIWTNIATQTTSTEFDFTGATTTYKFKTRASDSLNNFSDWSAEQSITIEADNDDPPEPEVPEALRNLLKNGPHMNWIFTQNSWKIYYLERAASSTEAGAYALMETPDTIYQDKSYQYIYEMVGKKTTVDSFQTPPDWMASQNDLFEQYFPDYWDLMDSGYAFALIEAPDELGYGKYCVAEHGSYACDYQYGPPGFDPYNVTPSI